jgi:hypothetical protein
MKKITYIKSIAYPQELIDVLVHMLIAIQENDVDMFDQYKKELDDMTS